MVKIENWEEYKLHKRQELGKYKLHSVHNLAHDPKPKKIEAGVRKVDARSKDIHKLSFRCYIYYKGYFAR